MISNPIGTYIFQFLIACLDIMKPIAFVSNLSIACNIVYSIIIIIISITYMWIYTFGLGKWKMRTWMNPISTSILERLIASIIHTYCHTIIKCNTFTFNGICFIKIIISLSTQILIYALQTILITISINPISTL